MTKHRTLLLDETFKAMLVKIVRVLRAVHVANATIRFLDRADKPSDVERETAQVAAELVARDFAAHRE